MNRPPTFRTSGIENTRGPPDSARSRANLALRSADVSGRSRRYATPTTPATAIPTPTFFAVDMVPQLRPRELNPVLVVYEPSMRADADRSRARSAFALQTGRAPSARGDARSGRRGGGGRGGLGGHAADGEPDDETDAADEPGRLHEIRHDGPSLSVPLRAFVCRSIKQRLDGTRPNIDQPLRGNSKPVTTGRAPLRVLSAARLSLRSRSALSTAMRSRDSRSRCRSTLPR